MREISAVESCGLSRRGVLADAGSLVAITIVSALPYVGRLGFYSDDWSILEGFASSGNGRLLHFVNGGFPARPVQGLYLASLYELFGFEPIGYHLADTVVLAGCAALFYLLLIRLHFSRAQSFAAVVIFLLLPQLSTVRVWYAAFQVPLSMALMFASMHWQLSFSRSGRIVVLAGAIVSAMLSVGAYEIFAPLIAGFAVVLIFLRWRESKRGWRPIAWTAIVLALMVAGLAYKVMVSGRAGPVGDPKRYLDGLHQLFRLDYDWRVDSGLNIIATPRAHFWAPIRGWWTGAGALVRGQPGLEVVAIAAAIFVITVWRLVAREEPSPEAGSKRLLLFGILAFLLGNATFLIVPAVAFTSTGMDNRVHVAAAIGVAMIFAALICLLVAKVVGQRHRQIVFAAAIAASSAAGFARIAQIENYYVETPWLQQRVLSAARVDLAKLPPNATVILDGVCPYHGPAVVFEAPWDISAALTRALGRPINGDAVSPRMSLTASGLSTSIYKVPSFYPYGLNLYAYNPVKHQLVRLADHALAANYFDNRNEAPCPGNVAGGVEV